MKVHPHILTSSEILKAAEDSIGIEKMGTTIVLAKCFEDNSFVVCNVGDSRAYLWRANRQLKELTKDHSLVQELVNGGMIAREEARTYKLKNIITKFLGARNFEEPDIHYFNWKPGYCLLLCSDGLTNALDDNQIEAVISNNIVLGPQKVCNLLITKANENGGKDNITSILAENRGYNFGSKRESQFA